MENIVIDRTDSYFKFEIAARPGAGNFNRCFSCGTCTASCPVSEIDESFNPRLIIRQALLGRKEELLSSKELWYCAQCYTCYARCPQDVRFTDILAVLRQMAVEAGYAPASLIQDMKDIDILTQQIRRKLAEYACDLGASDVSDAEQRIAEIGKLLAEGARGLNGNE